MSFKLALSCAACFQEVAAGPCNATTFEYLMQLTAGGHEGCQHPSPAAVAPEGQLTNEERAKLGLPLI